MHLLSLEANVRFWTQGGPEIWQNLKTKSFKLIGFSDMTKKTLDMTGQLWRPITRQPLSHESVAALAAGGFSSGGQGAHSYL